MCDQEMIAGLPQVGRFVLSTGTNWYTCYRCSYDLCVSCVHRRLDRVSREATQSLVHYIYTVKMRY